MGHGLKARKSRGKCARCWAVFKGDLPILTFQNKTYHESCWEEVFKEEKRAVSKKANQKRSI